MGCGSVLHSTASPVGWRPFRPRVSPPVKWVCHPGLLPLPGRVSAGSLIPLRVLLGTVAVQLLLEGGCVVGPFGVGGMGSIPKRKQKKYLFSC